MTLVIGAALAGPAALAQTPAEPLAVQSQPGTAPQPLTFQQAVARALEVNNTVERARADIGVAEAGRRQLFSSVLPRIALSGAATRNSEEVSFGSGTDARTILPQNDWNYRLVLTQPLYAGRREFRAYSQAKLGVENAREAERGTEDAVLLRVSSNYLAAVNADRRMAIERRNIELAEKRRTQAQAFYDAGEVTKVDVLRAETAIKASQRVLAVAEQNRENAVSGLRADLDLDGPIAVATSEKPLPDVPAEATLVTQAEQSRADVQVAENNLRIASLEVQKQHGFWLPTVTFEGGWIDQKSAFPASRYSYGRLNFNVPLLQSGEVEARVAGARARELQAKLDLDTARIGAREDVRRALSDLRSAETSLRLANDQLIAAEAEYQQEFDLYRAQESTSLDLASSEASLADARRAVAEETLNRDLAELRVWYAAGALKDAVGASTVVPAAATSTTGAELQLPAEPAATTTK
jgi:outer membrane protein TolC